MKLEINSSTLHLSRKVAASLCTAIGVFALGACGTAPQASQPEASGPDSGTLDADCDQLVGPRGLIAAAMAFADSQVILTADPEGNTDAVRYDVQEHMLKIAATADRGLVDPVGQIVDFLDDPPTYVRDKALLAKVRSAASEIQEVCSQGVSGAPTDAAVGLGMRDSSRSDAALQTVVAQERNPDPSPPSRHYDRQSCQDPKEDPVPAHLFR